MCLGFSFTWDNRLLPDACSGALQACNAGSFNFQKFYMRLQSLKWFIKLMSVVWFVLARVCIPVRACMHLCADHVTNNAHPTWLQPERDTVSNNVKHSMLSRGNALTFHRLQILVDAALPIYIGVILCS